CSTPASPARRNSSSWPAPAAPSPPPSAPQAPAAATPPSPTVSRPPCSTGPGTARVGQYASDDDRPSGRRHPEPAVLARRHWSWVSQRIRGRVAWGFLISRHPAGNLICPRTGMIRRWAGLTALFRDLDQEQPRARDAADKSCEYRGNQDVQSRALAEDQDYPRSQQQRRRERVRRDSIQDGCDRLIALGALRAAVQDVQAGASEHGENDQLGAERAVR